MSATYYDITSFGGELDKIEKDGIKPADPIRS